VIACKTPAVEIAGIGVNPDGEWMKQMARNLTDSVDGILRQARYLIHDRDPVFAKAFASILRARGVKCVKIPAQSANRNPHAERFVKTIKYESLNQVVLFGERHLRYVVKELMANYHVERFHEALGGQLTEKPTPSADDTGAMGKVVCRCRLGGMLNVYYRKAASGGTMKSRRLRGSAPSAISGTAPTARVRADRLLRRARVSERCGAGRDGRKSGHGSSRLAE
jgi:hypothetical protein